MKRKIPFAKYTFCGNNFVLVDETKTPLFSEIEKATFANLATNTYFGVGSDNFLVIQKCNSQVLSEINQTHGYWSKTPQLNSADFIFRMFEPDGTEAFSCGNGLMCIANFLFRKYDMKFARVVTEIPTASPKVVTIGTESTHNMNWVNLGHPRKISHDMFKPEVKESYDDVVQLLNELIISFRIHDLEPFSNNTYLSLKGYLVFIGEPHLVVFSGKDVSLDGFEKTLFASSAKGISHGGIIEKRINFGTWLVDQIGMRINHKYANLFPAGMNVNFVRPVYKNKVNILEYRCFERGINKETLACGTGAVAISYISKRLNITRTKQNTIWPYLCRLYNSDAQIHVSEEESGWLLHGYPEMLFKGEFESNSS